MTDTYVAPQLDYKKYNYSYPVYKQSKILPLSGTTTFNVSATGGDETLFELPPKVFNLAKSYLSFTVTTVNALTHATWYASDVFPFIRQIQLYTRGGLFLADVNNLDVYTKAVFKTDTKLEDFLTFEKHTASTVIGVGGWGQMFQPNNNILTANTLGSKYDGTAGNVSYLEPAYNISQNDLVAANHSLGIKLDLSMIKNTLFAVDHDLLFDEVIVMRVVWNVPAKYTHDGSSITDPTAGSAPLVGNVTIGALQMYLAIETNQDVVNQIKEKKNSSDGLSILMPYVYGNKVLLAAGSVAVSLRFNRGHGLKLLKIYHQPILGPETIGTTAYLANNAASAEITDFYTLLNNQRLQEFNITCANGEDWMLLKDRLKGSCMISRGVYNYNWVWLDDFSGYIAPINENIRPDDDNFIRGIDLSTEQKWDIFLTQAAANLSHYTFSVTQKMLVINSSGIQIM